MRALRLIRRILLFVFLTALTQVGGLAYLASLPANKFIRQRLNNKLTICIYRLLIFLVVYSLVSFIIVPAIAKSFGRITLPVYREKNIQPLNMLTCLLNRNYVKPELKQAFSEIAEQMQQYYPGTVIQYLDAGFPFFDKFPLLPHLSHNDGKKLDIAFLYIDYKSGRQSNDAPSIIGYGVCEEPKQGEVDMPAICSQQHYWQYNFLKKIVPQNRKKNFKLDVDRTRKLVTLFAQNASIGKIFIEPHLKTRMQITSNKVRFQGCHAIRHDDHIHVQLN